MLEPCQTFDEIQEASNKLFKLGKQSEELTGNINNIATGTMEKIREIDPQKVKVTSETKKLCSEILVMVKDAQKYMEDVDKFAWHGKHSKQTEFVLQSISQENPTLEPLNDYIKLLLRCLDNIELSYKSFCKASKITETTLQQLMAELEEKGNAEKTKGTALNVVTGVGAGGAAVSAVTVGAVGVAAIIAGVFSAGMGTVVALGTAAAVLSVGVAGASYLVATGFKNKEQAFRQLAIQTRVIQDSAKSMQLVVFTINKSLKEIGTDVKNIHHYKYTTILVDTLRQLFNSMAVLGDISFTCCKTLVSLEVDLKAHVRQLTVA